MKLVMEAVEYTVRIDIECLSEQIESAKQDVLNCTCKVKRIALNRNLTDLEYRRTSLGRSLLNIGKTYKVIYPN